MATNNEIPTYTKVGIRVTTVIMLVLLFLLAKSCVLSVMYGTATSDREIQQYYDMGYNSGLAGGKDGLAPHEPQDDNPMLIKSYRKGYRAGRDAARPGE